MKETQKKLKRRRAERQMKQENFTNNKKQKFKNEIGITLIALVVTIVVLLILAGITINLLFSNGGIFKTAEDAADAWNEATIKEQASLENITDQIDNLVNGTNTQTGPVTNPYEPDEWIMAWTCTDGTWSDTINSGETAEGDIVAKLYTTGKKITPPNITVLGNEYSFPEGDEYKLVIEGQGNMGTLMISTNNTVDTIVAAYAWQYSGLLYLGGYSDTCIIPYVTELIICDGVTNIGEYACLAGASLQEVKLGKDIKTIGQFSINTCVSLENIIIPDGVTEIARNAFYGCTSLTNIAIPNTVTSIGEQAIGGCTSLTNITYKGTQAEWNNIEKDSSWSSGSSITSITCADGVITL